MITHISEKETQLVSMLRKTGEALDACTAERDALELSIDQWRVDYHELRIESEALVVAAKLAMDALDALGDSSDRDVAPEIWFTSKADAAFNALKELLK